MDGHFIVDAWLLEQAREGDASAQYQIGLQALSEEQFGYAALFFKLAHKNHHSLAWQYYLVASRLGDSLFERLIVSPT